jgi:hypothetical protein
MKFKYSLILLMIALGNTLNAQNVDNKNDGHSHEDHQIH